MKKRMAALATLTVSALAFGVMSASAAEITNEDFENGLQYGLDQSFTIVEEGGNHSLMLDGNNDGVGAWASAGISPLSDYTFSDFTFSCDIKLLSFASEDAAFGIYFRGSEETDETPGYRFLLGNQDAGAASETFNVQFEKDQDGGREWPDPAVNINDQVQLSTWSKLVLVAEGDQFELYMGADEDSMYKVCSATDATHAEGGFRFSVWGCDVQIDNLSIVETVNRPDAEELPAPSDNNSEPSSDNESGTPSDNEGTASDDNQSGTPADNNGAIIPIVVVAVVVVVLVVGIIIAVIVKKKGASSK